MRDQCNTEWKRWESFLWSKTRIPSFEGNSNSCLTGKLKFLFDRKNSCFLFSSFLCCCGWGNKPLCTATSCTWEVLPDNMLKPQQFSFCFLWEVAGAVVVLWKALLHSGAMNSSFALEFHKQQGLFLNHCFYVLVLCRMEFLFLLAFLTPTLIECLFVSLLSGWNLFFLADSPCWNSLLQLIR